MRAEELRAETPVPAEIRVVRGSGQEGMLERLRRALGRNRIPWEERQEGDSTVLVYTVTLEHALEMEGDTVGGTVRQTLLNAYPELAEDAKSLERRLEMLRAGAPR